MDRDTRTAVLSARAVLKILTDNVACQHSQARYHFVGHAEHFYVGPNQLANAFVEPENWQEEMTFLKPKLPVCRNIRRLNEHSVVHRVRRHGNVVIVVLSAT